MATSKRDGMFLFFSIPRPGGFLYAVFLGPDLSTEVKQQFLAACRTNDNEEGTAVPLKLVSDHSEVYYSFFFSRGGNSISFLTGYAALWMRGLACFLGLDGCSVVPVAVEAARRPRGARATLILAKRAGDENLPGKQQRRRRFPREA
ncbi:hypothetical protein MRX96_054987 [Rhipicephalus microplus]